MSMFSSALGELRGLIRSKPAKNRQKLDLCFAPGENGLQRAWDTAYGERAARSEEDRNNALCTVLWLCAERPPALSIAQVVKPSMQILSHVLSQLRSAADAISTATGQLGFVAVGAEGESVGEPVCLGWKECGGAVALLDAASTLFVQLSATPQYRQLLLQHDAPQAMRHAVSRLTACVKALGAGSWPETPTELGTPNEHSKQQQTLLNTLYGCVLLLGCLWQACYSC